MWFAKTHPTPTSVYVTVWGKQSNISPSVTLSGWRLMPWDTDTGGHCPAHSLLLQNGIGKSVLAD